MFCATRRFGTMDWFETRDRSGYQYTLMDSPEDMLLVAAKESEFPSKTRRAARAAVLAAKRSARSWLAL